MNDEFNDRVNQVTGARSGIGRAMSTAFAKTSSRVVATDKNKYQEVGSS
jgi:NAD(P)-dependent dehydrogenase (short-subunit alcohol dehydrogenase family)